MTANPTDPTIRAISPTLPTLATEPYYHPSGDEVALFSAAQARRLPVLLKGPTGCGKTRFVEYMAWQLQRPLVTVACHDDLSTADLIGRYLVIDDNTVWVDGPLTAAVRAGAICYLDEIVEARKDTTVVIHPLADARRILPVEKRGEFVRAPADVELQTIVHGGALVEVRADAGEINHVAPVAADRRLGSPLFGVADPGRRPGEVARSEEAFRRAQHVDQQRPRHGHHEDQDEGREEDAVGQIGGEDHLEQREGHQQELRLPRPGVEQLQPLTQRGEIGE